MVATRDESGMNCRAHGGCGLVYSPEYVEGAFSEVGIQQIERARPRMSVSGPSYDFVRGGPPDGSLHAALPSAVAQEAIGKG
jgi:hypothetical protein